MKVDDVNTILREIKTQTPNISRTVLLYTASQKLKTSLYLLSKFVKDNNINVEIVDKEKIPRGQNLVAYVENLRNNGVVSKNAVVDRLVTEFNKSPSTVHNYLNQDGIRFNSYGTQKQINNNVNVEERDMDIKTAVKNTVQSCLPENYEYQGMMEIKSDGSLIDEMHIVVDKMNKCVIQKNNLRDLTQMCWELSNKSKKKPRNNKQVVQHIED